MDMEIGLLHPILPSSVTTGVLVGCRLPIPLRSEEETSYGLWNKPIFRHDCVPVRPGGSRLFIGDERAGSVEHL